MLILAAVLAFAGAAHANGDAEAGKALTGTCVACHGEDGNSLAGAFPNIAGQTEQYLLKQLKQGAISEMTVAFMIKPTNWVTDQIQ